MAGKSGKRKVIGVPAIGRDLDLQDYLDDLPPVLRVVRFKKSLVAVCVGCREEVGYACNYGMLKLKCDTSCLCGPGVNTRPLSCSCRARHNKELHVLVRLETGIVECGKCHQQCGRALMLPYDGDIIVVFESPEDEKKRRAVTI